MQQGAQISVAGIPIGGSAPLVLVAGPCVIEAEETTRRTAGVLVELCGRLGLPLIFKSSYEKDNRSEAGAFRGPGLDAGLTILARLRRELGLLVTTDVHRVADVPAVAQAVDLLQIPALLCRQTSLLEAAAASGRPVNVKKGQFLGADAMAGAVAKLRNAGASAVLLTERGSCFGPERLVCDFTSLPVLAGHGCPVLVDAGHASNRREEIPLLARCGVAAGADGLFLECHPDPTAAACDGGRMLSLAELASLLERLLPLAEAVRETARV